MPTATPTSHWIGFHVFVILLLAAELLYARRRTAASPDARTHSTSIVATILFLALLAIELTDVVFALDSIPAVLSITRHPFLAYTSNIMAVMGLRSLYFLLAHLLAKLRYLHYGLAGVLAFAALKMLSAHWLNIGPLTSLAVILVILGTTIGISLVTNPVPSIGNV